MDELTKNLTRLLRHLNFSDIRINNDSEYPDPQVNHTLIKEMGYTPPLMAQKNEIIYYFEFIEDNPKDLKRLKRPLQKIIKLGYERWDADFILVTHYGNKDTVREWCQNNKLPVDQIWEM
ncbi:hypothetical protein LQ318_00870 [Aliifodinibius salicampi]|uniref:Uncharacterized protein n=1 Tax=Fodinibius salicampi TaxID=1920655 RepID=A0ABT3PUB3_9BACT|nr:hypothetical protein [Fodinibius salicampi]MCW9711441.1 hypothetical protein [Fodinibius salicampi]